MEIVGAGFFREVIDGRLGLVWGPLHSSSCGGPVNPCSIYVNHERVRERGSTSEASSIHKIS